MFDFMNYLNKKTNNKVLVFIQLHKRKLLAFSPVVILLVIGHLYLYSGSVVSTDNAYIKADKLSISTDINGRVIEVNATDNQTVKAGDTLFKLDDEFLKIVCARIEAQLIKIKNNIEKRKALYKEKQEELKLAEKDMVYYKEELNRQIQLNEKHFASDSQKDSAQHNFDQAEQKFKEIKKDLDAELSYLNGVADIAIEQHPHYLQVKADLDKAQLDLRRAIVSAPVNGVVTRLTLVPGEYVNAGYPVFSLVLTDNLWVEANLKETELKDVKVGQKAIVKLDAFPDYQWDGVVDSISEASGAEFSLLPPQNATGNWIKIVQRIPVRIKLNRTPNEPTLRIGMSTTVDIHTSSSPLEG